MAYYPNSVNVATGNPVTLGTSLSSSGVTLVTAGANGSDAVVSLLFNNAPRTLSTQLVTLTASTGTIFTVDKAYDGVSFAIVYQSGNSSIFTCATGGNPAGTSTQTITGAGFSAVGQAKLRILGGALS